MDQYQEYIAASRYARYLDDKGRRENWSETVWRYVDYIFSRTPAITENKELKDRIYKAIYNMEVVPSMRAMMTAGKSADRDNTCIYNCSYLPIDDPKAFDEAMHILLCGTGVGFSVESKYVSQLPEVPEKLFESDHVIAVHDSKEGWAKALRLLIAHLYAGEVPKWDVSKVRPAGARLKTFGGRASGPEPLEDLFQFTVNMFKHAKGRKLNTLECHDLMCKIGEVVVVGGVRRSAMISLSDLDDERMRHAKSGPWWETAPHRALANNSAVYNETPPVGKFMEEWVSLYNSHSGERGIFNREAAKKTVAKYGHRDPNYDFGTNPCCFTGDMRLLTDNGYWKFSQLAQWDYVNIVNSNGKVTEGKVWSSGIKPVYEVAFAGEKDSITCTADHRFMLADGSECEAKDLKGKRVKSFYIPAPIGDNSALLAGFAFGDGATHRLGSEHHKGMEVWFGAKDGDVAALFGQPIGKWYSRSAFAACVLHGVQAQSQLEKRLPEVTFGDFLQGLYSANGSVIKGHRVAFKTISGMLAQDIKHRLKEKFDIDSYVTVNKAKLNKFSNGEYMMKESYDVNISSLPSLIRFAENINFIQTYKRQALAELIDAKSPFVMSVKYVSDQEVFDFTEPETHWGVVEGVVVHNSEIILRPYSFCNLSECVVRHDDTLETLKNKVELATILGTIQSTFTKFPYLRKIWQRNAEEERLLGVSLTGIFDNKSMVDLGKTQEWLPQLREHARKTNEQYAAMLGITTSTAITCVKPSGTVSQLVDSASGIHPRHSTYYIRRVRGDKKDPLTAFLVQQGVPAEDCVYKPTQTTVFSFPQRAPDGCYTREDVTPIFHLTAWLKYQREWCEHKPSVTISVEEKDWPSVGAWVWDHFDEISGVSFLPHDGGTYRQAPYEECTEEQYNQLKSKMPTLDWSKFKEETDNVEGAQMLACVAGVCEI